MTEKRIGITGAAGFIGYHLAKNLREEGHFVVGLDNFNEYYPKELKIARASNLKNLDVQIIQKDILEKDAILNFIRTNKLTHLVHLAAQAGVRYSLFQPDSYIQTNIAGFLEVLEAHRKYPDVSLIYASSSSVYGTNTKVPFSIDDPTDNAANIYGVSKKTKELMAATYNHLYNIPAVGLRFFTVYGPWGRPDMAYYTFTRKILNDEPIELNNGGKMWRDFTYVDDIVSGIKSTFSFRNGHHIFNLGNSQPESIETLVDLIEQETGKKAKKVFSPIPPGEIITTYADIKESEQLLKFSPKTTLAHGISSFVRWYKEYHGVE